MANGPENKDTLPWLEAVPEDRPVTKAPFVAKKAIIAGTSIVIFGLFVALVWNSYRAGPDEAGNVDVPLVKADNADIKIKPQDPGGLDIPDQDKLVYNRLNGDDNEEDLSLRKSAELPMAKPVPSTQDLSEGSDVQAMIPKTPVTEDTPSQEQAAPSVAEELPTKTEVAAPKEQPVQATTNAPLDGPYMVQLGAFREKAAAESLWHSLQEKHPSTLTPLTAEYIMVDLGPKGILYRLRAGSLPDREAADQLCSQLKAKGQACIVARR